MDLTAMVRLSRFRNGYGQRSERRPADNSAAPPQSGQQSGQQSGRLWGCTSLLIVLLLGVTLRPAFAQDIWFGPRWQDPQLMDLFKPGAAWATAASHMKVFEISGDLFVRAPKDQQLQMIAGLQRLHMELSVGVQGLSAHGPGHCGYNTEGYGAEAGVQNLMQRITMVGGSPRYFAFDEPLYFGHDFDRDPGRVGCRLPIADLVKDVANKVRLMHAAFPNAAIGDGEPVFALSDAEIEQWLDAYEASTGTKLAFMRFDMDWRSPWPARIASIAPLLRRKGVAMQVIYNGSGLDKTDEQWMAHAAANFQAFETRIRPPPSAILIQSWNTSPSHLLPENDPRTLTNLIDQYFAWRQSRH